MSETRLIVGLGNPGSGYEWTRHNLGFLVVRELARRHHLRFRRHSSFRGLVARGDLGEAEGVLLLPSTFMNRSGTAVKRLIKANDIAPENVLVVCDDFHLDLGMMRVRGQGSDGGHNGLASVIEHLGTSRVARLRVGIGAPPGRQDPAEFVLEEFDSREKQSLDGLVARAADCCQDWIEKDLAYVMTQFNKRKGNG